MILFTLYIQEIIEFNEINTFFWLIFGKSYFPRYVNIKQSDLHLELKNNAASIMETSYAIL